MRLMHPASDQEVEVDSGRAHHYLSQGWREVAGDAPKGNAPKAEWVSYALTQGFSAADVEGKTRAELRAALA